MYTHGPRGPFVPFIHSDSELKLSLLLPSGSSKEDIIASTSIPPLSLLSCVPHTYTLLLPLPPPSSPSPFYPRPGVMNSMQHDPSTGARYTVSILGTGGGASMQTYLISWWWIAPLAFALPTHFIRKLHYFYV